MSVNIMPWFIAVAMLVVGVSSAPRAADNATITFSDLRIEASAAPVAVAYFTAQTTRDDRITHLTSECCKAVELHRNERRDDGVMRMRKMDGLALNQKVALRVQPSARGGDAKLGLHVMLIGIKAPLTAGAQVPITVHFEKSPPQTLAFPVMDRASASNSTDPHAHH